MQPVAAWQAAPATYAVAVTPSDATDLTRQGSGFRALYIGVTGNVAVVMLSGDTVLFSNVPVGILPVQGTKVNSTNTTATSIVALY